jgi:mRNA-degrading endonuclease RelE of RelBE toxin-antitoxin system
MATNRLEDLLSELNVDFKKEKGNITTYIAKIGKYVVVITPANNRYIVDFLLVNLPRIPFDSFESFRIWVKETI